VRVVTNGDESRSSDAAGPGRCARRQGGSVQANLRVEHVRDHADEVAGRLEHEEQIQLARESLKRLPKQQRQIVELCIWAGLDQQAAAVALDIPIGTVKSRLSRARKQLRALDPDSDLEA
jgi:RNA polymerase sigma factor (sigma-70 family)